MKKLSLLLLIALLCISTTEAGRVKKKKKKKEILVTISTKFGDMVVYLFDDTPLHKVNFIKLAREGYYDSTSFHRVINNFMIQGGDPLSKDNNPLNDGQGGPNYTIPAEIRDTHKHERGALCAARRGDMVNPNRESNGSQFYIVHNTQGAQHLDGSYTVFGKIIKGIEVVDSIAAQPTGQMAQPNTAIRMSMKVETLKLRKIRKLYGLDLR